MLPHAHYQTFSSILGQLLLVKTEGGLLKIAFEKDQDSTMDLLKESFTLKRSSEELADTTLQLTQYLSGFRTTFTLPVDLHLVEGFKRRVQDALLSVPYARTITYQQLAERIDAPTAARAVGTACANNPLPIVYPCHRIIRKGGDLGEYVGGSETKKLLLDLERNNSANLVRL